MTESIDWGNELWASLTWIGIVFGIALAVMLAVGFLLARLTTWGRQYWRLAGGFFVGRDTRVGAWILVLLLLLLAIIGVRLTVLLTYQGNDLFSSFQYVAQGLTSGQTAVLDEGKRLFWKATTLFAILATLHVARTLVEIYLGSMFEIRLRAFLTVRTTTDWLDGMAFFRNRFVKQGLAGEDAHIQPGVDNPDQRIEIDTANVATVSRQLVFGSNGSSANGVIPAVITIVSFTKILWDLSGPMTVFGLDIPRAMVWFTYGFALLATVVAFWLGHPLIRLYFLRERFSANFRYALVRLRDGAENVAFYGGEKVERTGILDRFSAIVENFWQIVYRTLKFTGWNFVMTQASAIFVFLIQFPRFASGQIRLGDMTQAASAFSNLYEALSFFRQAYDTFADFRASLYRLDGLDKVDAESRKLATIATTDSPGVRLSDVSVSTPSGTDLISGLSLSLGSGDAMVVKGPSGSGKTTLLRGLAGLWPFVGGEFARPPGDRTMFVTQIPYIPLGDLRTAVAYPLEPDGVGDDAIREALRMVFLPHLVDRLDEEQDWAKILSPGEQQRVAFARILLSRPDAVFLDEATSAVDEGLEYALYSLIRAELPQTILVSVSHRSTTDQHHAGLLDLSGEGGWELRPIS